jgi:hypothetical protein
MDTYEWKAERVRYLLDAKAAFTVSHGDRTVGVVGSERGWSMSGWRGGRMESTVDIRDGACRSTSPLAERMGASIMEGLADEAEAAARILSVWGLDPAKADEIRVAS